MTDDFFSNMKQQKTLRCFLTKLSQLPCAESGVVKVDRYFTKKEHENKLNIPNFQQQKSNIFVALIAIISTTSGSSSTLSTHKSQPLLLGSSGLGPNHCLINKRDKR